MTQVRILVYGKVQGVYFRQSTKDIALKLGLTGSVRNLKDGQVEMFAMGSQEAIDELIEWVRAGGPAGAAVIGVSVAESEFEAKPDFRIL